MPKNTSKKSPSQVIALTGATGFLGTHMLDSLLDAGHTVKALTRRPQTERDGIEWIEGSLTDENSLNKLCENVDTVLHLAGLVKALNRDAFFDVNVKGSKLLFDAAVRKNVKHVLHVSSLAAREPYVSHYGASKAGSELLLTARKWPFKWTIVRPPAIYGPGDLEILKILKATRFGILPAPGSRKNRFSMIHVRDMADAITHLANASHTTQIVEVDDNKAGGYRIKDVAAALAHGDKKPAKTLAIPFWVLAPIGAVNGMIASAINRPVMLTLSTARHLCYPDWTVREPRRPNLPNWSPQYNLKTGLSQTIDWYKKNGLL